MLWRFEGGGGREEKSMMLGSGREEPCGKVEVEFLKTRLLAFCLRVLVLAVAELVGRRGWVAVFAGEDVPLKEEDGMAAPPPRMRG